MKKVPRRGSATQRGIVAISIGSEKNNAMSLDFCCLTLVLITSVSISHTTGLDSTLVILDC
jgi:hypothetical protein